MWMWGPYQKRGRAYLPAKFEARLCMNVSCPNTAMFISGTVWVANAICLEQRQLPKLGNVQPCLDQFYSFLNSWSPGQTTRTPPEYPGRPLGRVIRVFKGSEPLLECPFYRYILKAKGTPCTRGRSTRWTTWAWSWSSTTSVTTPDTRGSGGKSWGTFSRHEEGFYVFICVFVLLDFYPDNTRVQRLLTLSLCSLGFSFKTPSWSWHLVLCWCLSPGLVRSLSLLHSRWKDMGYWK